MPHNLAIVADWLPTFGGAEHVVSEFTRIWPSAPLFTTLARRGAIGPLKDANLQLSWLQQLYQLVGSHQYLLPLMPSAVEGWDFSGFDVILSSSHAVAKGIIPPSSAVHICYCHTPIRYAWEMEDEYLSDFHVRGYLRTLAKEQLKKLRRWDLTTAKRVDHFIANSSETKERIARIYGRDSVVISPPVHDRFFATQHSKLVTRTSSYYLALGRFVPYKRFDLLIELANTLNLPLKIAGSGDDEKRLKSLAGPTVEFLGYVPDAELPGLYAGAKAVLFPQHEDAGLVPLESLASGTPVIAYHKGGVLDAVEHGVTGLLADAQTVDAFAEAIRTFETMTWDRQKVRDRAARYSVANFHRQISDEVSAALRKYGRKKIEN